MRLVFFVLVASFFSWPSFARLTFQGQTSAFGLTMPLQTKDNVTQSGAGATLEFNLENSWSKSWRLDLGAWLQADALNESVTEKFQVEPQKVSVTWRRKGQRLVLGFHTMTWEGTDLVNPMALLHSRNWRDPLDSHSLSSPGIYYSNQIASFSWDMVYIPRQTKSVLPGDNSPWWPRRVNLPLETDEFIVLLPPDIEYKVHDERILNHALDHNVGLRLQYHGETADVSLAAFEGNSPMPILRPTAQFDLLPGNLLRARTPIEIDPIYYRHRVAAGALVIPVETWIFRLSAQYAQPLGTDPLLPGWSRYGVMAIERPVAFGKQEVRFLLQGVLAERGKSEGLSMLASLLEKSLMFGWRWAFAENWLWTTALFQEQVSQSYFGHTGLTWKTSDRTKQEWTVDLLGGPSRSSLGPYERNDRVSFRSTFLF
jgi:hypothetical protein